MRAPPSPTCRETSMVSPLSPPPSPFFVPGDRNIIPLPAAVAAFCGLNLAAFGRCDVSRARPAQPGAVHWGKKGNNFNGRTERRN